MRAAGRRPSRTHSGIRRQKRVDLLGCGRQADEIEAGAADQRSLVGGGSRMQSLALDALEDEAIDRRARPGRVPHGRRHPVCGAAGGTTALPAGRSSGHGAPARIQSVRSAISRSRDLPPEIGMLSFGSAWLTARIKRLSSGLPGTIAGPDLPPASSAARESDAQSAEFAIAMAAKQREASTGRTRFSKNSRGRPGHDAIATPTKKDRN